MKLKLPTDWRRRGLRALGAIVVLVVAWVVIAFVYRFFVLPRQAAENKAKAIVQEETSKAGAGAAQDALQTVTEIRREIVRVDDTTRRNDDAIKSAVGAGTRAPGVAAALHDSLCRRAAYSGEPDCAAVRGAGGELGPARRDAGGGAAGE